MLLKTKLSDDSELIIEVDETAQTEQVDDEYREPKAIQQVIDSGKNLINEAMIYIERCANELVVGINEIEEQVRPDEFEASLALKLSAEAGVVLSKISGEAQLQVKLTWKKK